MARHSSHPSGVRGETGRTDPRCVQLAMVGYSGLYTPGLSKLNPVAGSTATDLTTRPP
jgi:hypothetical protein